jgi:Zn-finger nucleic acid-binding protein
MNCPGCNQPMTDQINGEVCFDACSNCGGSFFNGDELRKMTDQALPDAAWMDIEMWKDAEALKLAWSERLCPVCGKPMAQIAYGQTGLVVDACVEHHGVYLDKGEFEAIVSALQDEIVEKDTPEYLRETLQQGKEVLAGGEGRHHEWQDFTTVVRLMADRFLVDHPSFAEALAEFALSVPK